MPEQNAPTPIALKDIRKGDRIRRTVVEEYDVTSESPASARAGVTFELLSRPVALPTIPDAVIRWEGLYYTHLAILETADQWLYEGNNYSSVEMAARITDTAVRGTTYAALRPVSEVAAEVLAAVKELSILHPSARDSDSYTVWVDTFADVAAQFGVTP